MGRLPTYFAGRQITHRTPYEMGGTVTLDAESSGVYFPQPTFMHQFDQPFEIHRMIPRVIALDDEGAPLATQVDPLILEFMTKVMITSLTPVATITKAAERISGLVKGNDEHTWEFADPFTLVRSEGLIVVADNLLAAAFITDYAATALQIVFQGFQIVVAPPTDTR